ncbi:cob(I)yrinic acid a c-diamide adenosyltransferase [Candidatus Paracaedimonas acanthamoebae]|nr:cob(I)yrinic acid a c-diamide adenosyltransferase [Candidatus Paracaedimonas acanthamoebae]
MVKLTKIYTKTGDLGSTGLGDGSRRKKYDIRIDAIGAVDEANAAIGMARLHTQNNDDGMLAHIQNDLFDLGADLCLPHDRRSKPTLRITHKQVERLEGEIDHMNENLKPLNSFVLPGGSHASATLHLARTIVRRAERAVYALNERESLNPEIGMYLNRLSDHLFVLARVLNDQGRADVLWQPGENQ